MRALAVLVAAAALWFAEPIGGVVGTVLGFLVGIISSAISLALR